jgi:hypothetical protein
VEVSTFALTSESSPQADIRPRCFNVAEVPEADVVEQFVPASGATPAGRRWSALMTPG